MVRASKHCIYEVFVELTVFWSVSTFFVFY